MILKFKSPVAGDVLMLPATAERVLGLLGKPAQGPGILEPQHMAQALAALQAAIEADDARRRAAEAAARAEPPAATEPDAAPLEPISLRQRAWPLVEMIKRSQAADKPVVWGV